MSGKELIFIIILPSTAAIITMFVTLAMQWMLEKEVNHKQPFFLFHIVNIIFIVLMCGTSSIVFYGLILKGLEIKGWLATFLNAYVYPLPLIILLYALTVPFFRSYMQPYRIKRDTNIVYLKNSGKK